MPVSRNQSGLIIIEQAPFDCCGQRVPTLCLVAALLVICLPAAAVSAVMIVIALNSSCALHPKLPTYFMLSGAITLCMLICVVLVWYIELKAIKLQRDWRIRHCVPYLTITLLLLCFGWHIFVTILTEGLRPRHACDYLNEPYAVWCVCGVTAFTGLLALLHCCTFDWKICEAEPSSV